MELKISIPVTVGIFFGVILLHAAPLKLTENGTTPYGIVLPVNATKMEKLAARELQEYLKKSTGTEFKISASAGDHAIILKRDASLRAEESLVSINGKHLVLAGGDERGILYAVYCFLENQLGIRWFSAYGHEKIPVYQTLELEFSPYRQKPAFKNRALIGSNYYKSPESSMFFLRNRLNIGNELKNNSYPGSKPAIILKGHHCHTLFFYIPPAKGAYSEYLKFKEKKYYFKDHPEYFSMNSSGQRVTSMQLCFSNSGLRREFTRRFLEYAELSGGKGVYSISAQDWPGAFCYCPECRRLEKQYQCEAGPLLDYIIELCNTVKEKYPDLLISTLAYRKGQSERPPIMKDGEKLPDNFICVFAPIDDDFSKTLTHKNNQGTLQHLRDWTKIAKHVWVWYYPIVYGTVLPTGCVERAAADTRILYENGATGTYYEHDSGGIFAGLNFGDLMTWMFLKLFQDPHADINALRREFCEFYYGAAAEDMISYISDLDRMTAETGLFRSWNSGLLPGSSSETNLVRWQKLFDRMEAVTRKNPDVCRRVKDARIALDIASLQKDYKLFRKKHPDIFPEISVLKKRIRDSLNDSLLRRYPPKFANVRKIWAKGVLYTLENALIVASCTPKPLPPPLDRIDPAKIRQVFAKQVNNCGFEKTADSAFGQAIYDRKAKKPELPFSCGFYDEFGKRFLLTRKIHPGEIIPDRYALYKVGEAPISQRCRLWTGSSWLASIGMSKLYIPGEAPDKKYEIWISLKFEGLGYSPKSRSKINRVWIDRAVVVEK